MTRDKPCKFQGWTKRLKEAIRKEPAAKAEEYNEMIETVQTAAIAVHDEDGRIQMDITEDEDIDLSALEQRPDSEATLPEEVDEIMEKENQLEQSNHSTNANHASALTTDNGHVVVKVNGVVKTSVMDTSSPRKAPPVMNVCIMIVGTRGDVQPFIAIAHRLQQDNHRVRLATHAVYRDFVMSHGVEFYPLGGDPKELAAYMVRTGGHLIPYKLEHIQNDVPRNMQMIEEIIKSTWPAVSAPDPDGGGAPGVQGKPFQAHAIISNPVTYGHIHVAERLGVPLHIMFPQPWVPTRAFPHPLANMPYKNKPEKRNFISYKLVDLLMWQGTEGMVNEFRTHVLGLRKIRKGDGGRDMLLDLRIPHAFMWSPALVPKPKDWGKIYDVVGTVTLKERGSAYTPTPELEAFLGNDGGPIFVGFGSMILNDPVATTKMIIDAAIEANVRVLIQSSWSDMSGNLNVPDNVFFIGNCPHDWLMPRVSAVVHHGGAGTTAAGLLAGKPTFIVPFFGDQPFWGRAVVTAGVGVEPCPISELTVEKLRTAFEALKSSALQAKAIALRDVLLKEDGADEAVKSFYRHLPIESMLCDLCHDKIAIKWSVDDRIKMCESCNYIIGLIPENHAKKIVEYHCVDYTARGPGSGLAGASSGAAAFLHEVGGAVKDIIVKPARGFRDEGAKGAVIGVVKGVSGLLIRPVHGVALFADHIAAGHANMFHSNGSRRRGSVFDKQIMSAIGLENGLANSYSANMDPDDVKITKKDDRRMVSLRLTDEEKNMYQIRFKEIMDLRKGQTQLMDCIEKDDTPTSYYSEYSNDADKSESESAPITIGSVRLDSNGSVEMDFKMSNVGDDTLDDATLEEWREFSKAQEAKEAQKLKEFAGRSVPPMNICMITSGTWNSNIKQFVAVGLRLKADGHRVRIATHENFRREIMDRGLEFYPLGGSSAGLGDFIKYIHDAKSINVFKRHSVGRPVMADLHDMMFSLWPAAVGADPHGMGENIPGEQFRADLLLANPTVFGHVHVAQRLGIPLQCLSLQPLSPTFEFPHLLSTYFKNHTSCLTGEYKETNWLSYEVINTIVWRGMVDIINQFRASIGLSGSSDGPNLLVDWEIPHVYMINPALLSKPLDWGMELSVSGYVTLEDELESNKSKNVTLSRSLNEFTLSTGNPVIYFGVGSSCSVSRNMHDLRILLGKINTAAQLANLQVILQLETTKDREETTPYHSDNVYEVASDVPFAMLLRKVAATIHWGDSNMLNEAFAAGKPTCVCPLMTSQRFWANVGVKCGVALESIDLSTCTVNSLRTTFEKLVRDDIQTKAKELAKTYCSKDALDKVTETVYSNLPLPAMLCDLNPQKIARIYDTHNEMKLSYEAQLAIQPIRGHDSKDDINYKPLWYDGHEPPKYSLRGIRGEDVHNIKPKRRLGSIANALSSLVTRDTPPPPPQPPRSMPARSISRAAIVVEQPSFWLTPEAENAARVVIHRVYSQLLEQQEMERRNSGSRRSRRNSNPLPPSHHSMHLLAHGNTM